jgi:hypothetical protein
MLHLYIVKQNKQGQPTKHNVMKNEKKVKKVNEKVTARKQAREAWLK